VKAAGDQEGCLTTAEHSAEVTAIRQQVAAGRISKERIARVFPANMKKSAYLDADGNLLPYSQLDDSAIPYFDALRDQLLNSRRWHPLLANASLDAFKRVKQHCEAAK
jgi:hypothetical protein